MEILDLTAKALMWNYSIFDIRGLFENEWILLDFETRELIIIFLGYLMTLIEKVTNYKILDHIKLYNFGVKFNFIRDHEKGMNFSCENIFKDVSCPHPSLKIIFRSWWHHYPPLKIRF